MGIADPGLSRRSRRRAYTQSGASLRQNCSRGFQRRPLPQGVAQPVPVRTTLEMGLVSFG